MEEYINKYCKLIQIDPISYVEICNRIYDDNPKVERFRYSDGTIFDIDDDYKLSVDSILDIVGNKHIYSYKKFIVEFCDIKVKVGYRRGIYTIIERCMATLLYRGRYKAIYYHDGDISIIYSKNLYSITKNNIHKNLNILNDI